MRSAKRTQSGSAKQIHLRSAERRQSAGTGTCVPDNLKAAVFGLRLASAACPN